MGPGIARDSATCILLRHPAITSLSPFIIASKPALSLCRPTRVSSMSARAKKWMSVTPGMRQLTDRSVSLES
ncbi:hypothetical protein J2W23_004524 [Variovorax boronicumulans]|uniref:hypothetical protein n=1 Tax=Variovorax boronicumulans TaxID=436515 RepID=UPI00278AE857|nr:hypothetical protein [Variovorax boronicumulans]MDQ0016123.1 hypothetical protein [Variovorax boronicumulans]